MSTPLEVIEEGEREFEDNFVQTQAHNGILEESRTIWYIELKRKQTLALLQALHDELEGKKKIQNDALDLAKPHMGGAKCVITGRIEAIQDQQDNLQALMDSIRVWVHLQS